MQEVWKEIPGYEGYYEVSNYGEVRSMERTVVGKITKHLKSKVLSKAYNKIQNRYFIHLYKDLKGVSHSVSKLVLLAFVGPKPEGMEVCHNDGNSTNDRLENLRWDTHKNNINDKIKHGTLLKYQFIKNSKLKNDDAIEIIRLLKETNMTQSEIAEKYNIERSLISMINTGAIWKDIIKIDYPIRNELFNKSNVRQTKLTDEEALDVKIMMRDRVPRKQIIKKYNISINTLDNINRGISYSHVVVP